MAADIDPNAGHIEVAFRGAEAVVSAGVLGTALLAVRARGLRVLWADRGSAYMQLLLLTSATSLLQLLHAIIDIAWVARYYYGGAAVRGVPASGTPALSAGDDCLAGAMNSSHYCAIQRVDASMNVACLSLLLVAFIVVTFFFLRMAIRLRISNPDPVLLREAQAALKLPLVVSVGWIFIVLVSAVSGLQPKAFTCEDPVWLALLLSFILVGIALVSGVVVIVLERRKRRRGNKFWNSLLSLAAVLVLATILAILELLDHVLRAPGECFPLDEVAWMAYSSQGLPPIARGLVHLAGRSLIYTLPSLALLSLFRHQRRQRPRQGIDSSDSSIFSPSGSSITEALLRAPPSISSASDGDRGAGGGGLGGVGDVGALSRGSQLADD